MKNDVKNLISSFELPKTEFTKLLKVFQKANWGRYSFILEENDARLIFSNCLTFITSDENNNESKYNALRLIKFSLTNKIVFREVYEKVIMLLLYCLMHKYWNLRLEAFNLQHEFRFWTDVNSQAKYWKKITKKIKENHDYYRPLLIDLNFTLIKMNFEYEKKYKNILEFEDFSTTECIPYSIDTKDKILKSIRRVIEWFDYPYIQEKMRKFWYIE